MKYYVLIGLVGSGKSSWARKVAKDESVVIINRDAIRTMIKGEYVYDKKYEEFIRKYALSFIGMAYLNDLNVIIDEVNLTKKHREFWVENILHIDKRSFITFCNFPEWENNLKNRMTDPRGISEERWADVIENMKKGFEPIEKDEGYDKLTEWKINELQSQS